MHNDMSPENMWTGSQTQERVGHFQLCMEPRNEAKFSSILDLGVWGPAQLHPSPLQTLRRRAQWLQQHPAWTQSLCQQTKDHEDEGPCLGSQTLNGLSNLRAEWASTIYGSCRLPMLSSMLMGIPPIYLAPSLNTRLSHNASTSYSKVYIWWLFYIKDSDSSFPSSSISLF